MQAGLYILYEQCIVKSHYGADYTTLRKAQHVVVDDPPSPLGRSSSSASISSLTHPWLWWRLWKLTERLFWKAWAYLVSIDNDGL